MNTQLVIDKPVTCITKSHILQLVLCLLDLDLYVDIACMYYLHKEIYHNLLPVTHPSCIVKIIKVQQLTLVELHIIIRQL